MKRLGLVLFIVSIHAGDLLVAWLYGGGAWPEAALLRPARDAVVVVLAGLCLLTVRMPRALLVQVLCFCAFAAAHAPAGYLHGLPAGIVLGSLGIVLVPMLFLLAGHVCMPHPQDLRLAVRCLVWLGVASAAFGAWDVAHTDFWVHGVRLPEYLFNIKGVQPDGTDSETGLPWNFFGGEARERRAGGLPAAPLAQGQFLVTAALAALALWQRRWPWRALLACGCLLAGVWMSGTRGAMLAGIVAVMGYLLTSKGLVRSAAARLFLAGVVLAALVAASVGIVVASVNFRDGSTIGHWVALQRNLAELHQVLLLGGGVGRQSALSARQSLADLGGGEGSLFSIAYQIGIPGALLFLSIVGWCLHRLWVAYRLQRDPVVLAAFWLLCGIMTTFVSSENGLTVSGAGGFWLLLGGVLRHAAAARAAVPGASPGEAPAPGAPGGALGRQPAGGTGG